MNVVKVVFESNVFRSKPTENSVEYYLRHFFQIFVHIIVSIGLFFTVLK